MLSNVQELQVKYDVYAGSTSASATIVVEPLQRGYGTTIGNSLRRVLLSSIPGAAVCGVKINGVLHEFESIVGIKEEVMDIILNLKSLVVKLYNVDKKIIHVKVQGPCVVTPQMFDADSNVEIINKDLVICNITGNTKFEAEIYCASGVGYSSADQNKDDSWSIGMIAVDAIYTPIKTVSYKVESARVGQFTHFDKLVMDIETNGTLSPSDALSVAATMMQNQMALFVKSDNDSYETDSTSNKLGFNPVLLQKINDADISMRASNCLKSVNMIYVGDLVTKTEKEIAAIENLGATSLKEIKKWLSNLGLALGMDVVGWPPESVDELSKEYEKNGFNK